MVMVPGFKIVGVVHGTISDDTGGKFAAVSPGFYLYELLQELCSKFDPKLESP
jgi:hypothetical protein